MKRVGGVPNEDNVSVKLDIKKAFGNLLKQFTKAFSYFIGAI